MKILQNAAIDPRGQALVEFALVAPIFFLILFAIIEGGRFILYYETLNNATREGARYAIVNGANSMTVRTDQRAARLARCDPTGRRSIARVRRPSPVPADPAREGRAFGLLGDT